MGEALKAWGEPEDWIWHATLPFIAYAALLFAGLALAAGSGDTLFIIAGAP